MNSFEKTLLSQLIGLARATDGNEHLITAESTKAIVSCLNAHISTEQRLAEYLSRVEDVKRKMVPDCFLCANPCGRTSAYDLSLIDQEEPDIRNIKYSILSQLIEISKTWPDKETEIRPDLMCASPIA